MIVVDCSALIAGVLPDEVEAEAQRLLEELHHGHTVAVVPLLFYQEISNALLMAYRRNRIHRDHFWEYLEAISQLPVLVDTAAATQGTTMLTVCELAEKSSVVRV